MKLIHVFAPAYHVQLMGRFSIAVKPLLLFVPVSFVFLSTAAVTAAFDKISHIQHVLLLNCHPSHELKLIYVPSAYVDQLFSIPSFSTWLKTKEECTGKALIRQPLAKLYA